jgi:hypothetical protein
VHNAFLHGLLEEEVYMRQPPGFVDHAQPRARHARLASALRTHGFVPSTANTSLFLFQRQSVTVYLLVYVDHIILVSPSSTVVVDALIYSLGVDFVVKDLGQLQFFLGI